MSSSKVFNINQSVTKDQKSENKEISTKWKSKKKLETRVPSLNLFKVMPKDETIASKISSIV